MEAIVNDDVYSWNIDSKDRELMLDLIFKEQMRIIKKHPENFESKKYKRLESLKVKIKDWSV